MAGHQGPQVADRAERRGREKKRPGEPVFRLVEHLQPRLESSPDVLFARAPTLPPGEYMLHWTVRTMQDVKVTQGNIPFTVKSPP